MGTATFALPSLNQLFEKGYRIDAVITQADKPGGRGQTLLAPPVKKRAHELHLPVYQPLALKSDETRLLIEALSPEIIVVVAYGKIIPPWLLQFPRFGCINLHGSILPKYRGAAPVHWAVANGEAETGVCTMLLNEGLDTGPVLLCEKTSIKPEETMPQLYDRLADMGAPLLDATLQGVIQGTLQPKPQDDSQATYAPPLKKENGFIDWRMPAIQIQNRVRAFNPWPGTVTRFRGGICKILQTSIAPHDPLPRREARARQGEASSDDAAGGQPGAIVSSRHSLAVICGDGALLEILSIQPENRKPVRGADFANGARLQRDEKFEPLIDN
jgi:methionyl-tRNA formyltransferase